MAMRSVTAWATSVKALVTGAGGFLGLYVVEQLVARGDRVRAFGRRQPPRLADLRVEFCPGDLADREALRAACDGVDIVFHIAGMAGLGGRWASYYAVNTVGTRNVIDACRRSRVRRLVYTSSPSVTFDATDQEGIDESAPYPDRWLAHYPRSKALAEQAVLAANGSDGLATCALRPHLIWGPRDRNLNPRLIDRARRGQLRRVGDGANMIDSVYVENAATAHLQAADALSEGSPVAGRAYFISQGAPVNCWHWVDEILNLAGLPPVSKSLSFRAAWRMGWCYELVYRLLRLAGDPPLTRFLAAQMAKSHYFDIGRARRDFGYEPRVSHQEGMERMARALAQSGQ